MGYGTPVNAELQFWSAMRSYAKSISEQLTRIADALEANNARRSGPYDIRVGDAVMWDGPDVSEPDGWTVTGAPPCPTPNGVFSIRRADGTEAKVPVHELRLVPATGGVK